MNLSELSHVIGTKAQDFGVWFVHGSSDVRKYSTKIAQAAKADRLVWVCYPKKSSGWETDITRDTGWEALTKVGLRPVRQIAISEVWSALRWRRQELVGK